jgi:hypothetical protein
MVASTRMSCTMAATRRKQYAASLRIAVQSQSHTLESPDQLDTTQIQTMRFDAATWQLYVRASTVNAGTFQDKHELNSLGTPCSSAARVVCQWWLCLRLHRDTCSTLFRLARPLTTHNQPTAAFPSAKRGWPMAPAAGGAPTIALPFVG